MASFELFIGPLLQHEGGWADHPSDPGGKTNRGITIGLFRSVAGPVLGIEPTEANLRRLTIEQAARIYQSQFWDPLRCDLIRSQDVANQLADMGVNAGKKTAVRLLQSVLAGIFSLPVKVDGICGPVTIRATNQTHVPALALCYAAARLDYYRALVRRRTSSAVFLAGWEKRAMSWLDPAWRPVAQRLAA